MRLFIIDCGTEAKNKRCRTEVIPLWLRQGNVQEMKDWGQVNVEREEVYV